MCLVEEVQGIAIGEVQGESFNCKAVESCGVVKPVLLYRAEIWGVVSGRRL